MSPHEWDEFRDLFNMATLKFGWSRVTVRENHERDDDCTWQEAVWVDVNGNRLFSEDDAEKGLARELIRIANLMPTPFGICGNK